MGACEYGALLACEDCLRRAQELLKDDTVSATEWCGILMPLFSDDVDEYYVGGAIDLIGLALLRWEAIDYAMPFLDAVRAYVVEGREKVVCGCFALLQHVAQLRPDQKVIWCADDAFLDGVCRACGEAGALRNAAFGLLVALGDALPDGVVVAGCHGAAEELTNGRGARRAAAAFLVVALRRMPKICGDLSAGVGEAALDYLTNEGQCDGELAGGLFDLLALTLGTPRGGHLRTSEQLMRAAKRWARHWEAAEGLCRLIACDPDMVEWMAACGVLGDLVDGLPGLDGGTMAIVLGLIVGMCKMLPGEQARQVLSGACEELSRLCDHEEAGLRVLAEEALELCGAGCERDGFA